MWVSGSGCRNLAGLAFSETLFLLLRHQVGPALEKLSQWDIPELKASFIHTE